MKRPDNNIKDFTKSPVQRLDLFLVEELKITRSQAQKMIERGEVLVNNESPFKTGQKIGLKDKVTFKKPVPEKKTTKEKEAPIKKTKKFTFKDLIIVQKTPDYFIVDKPTGMLTHSTLKNETDSLAELMLKKFPEIKKVGEDPVRPGIVHRLDKEASGLLVVARTENMFEHLKKQFKKRTIQKEYIVLVHGKIAKDWDEINFRIDRSENADRMAARPTIEKGIASDIGKEALTEFTVEKRFVNFTLLRVKIHTGRMHQIRAHMLAYDHPVVGDPLYFQKKQKRTWDEKLGRLFLHCNKIAFEDLKGQTIIVESPLPEQLTNFLKTLV
jgi:23S rRNA pseudouridine1911/1915/1917 synthase